MNHAEFYYAARCFIESEKCKRRRAKLKRNVTRARLSLCNIFQLRIIRVAPTSRSSARSALIRAYDKATSWINLLLQPALRNYTFSFFPLIYPFSCNLFVLPITPPNISRRAVTYNEKNSSYIILYIHAHTKALALLTPRRY